jgi:hypothetical protein
MISIIIILAIDCVKKKLNDFNHHYIGIPFTQVVGPLPQRADLYLLHPAPPWSLFFFFFLANIVYIV